MNDPLIEVLIIFLLLVANGVFAMAEIAIVSARKARLQRLIDEGNSQAGTALELANNPTDFLSTVQVGITLIGIMAGAFGGATLAKNIGLYLNGIPWLAPYGEIIGIGLVVLGITYFSLIIGELVPKRLALNNAERIAVLVAAPMRNLSRIALPLVWFLSASTEAVLRVLGAKPSTEPPFTEEEIKVLIEQGTQIGIFEEVEQDMIEGVLRLNERRVSITMTPRPQIVWLDITDSPAEIRRKIARSQHSRFPVAKENLDNVLGIIAVKDLLADGLTEPSFDLRTLLRPPLFVPESISVLKVLELFKQQRSHLALVIDEYGGIEGLVTPNDILETIVGDLPSIDSVAEPLVIRREDGSWLLDGIVHIDKLKEILDLEELPGEEQGAYQTVGGFFVSQVGNIPVAGQHFEWSNMRFEVMDMDGRRVDKLLVTPLQIGSPNPGGPGR